MNETTLQNKIEELTELQQMIKDLEAMTETIKDEIKADLLSKGTDEIKTDKFKVSFKECFSNRIDSKKLKAELPEIYNQYLSINVTRRFSANLA